MGYNMKTAAGLYCREGVWLDMAGTKGKNHVGAKEAASLFGRGRLPGRRVNAIKRIFTLGVFTLLWIGIMIGPGASLAVSPGPAESEVKSAFVFNFI